MTIDRTIASFFVVAAVVAMVACGGRSASKPAFTDKERSQVEARVEAIANADSLQVLLHQYEAQADVLGQIVAQRRLGRLCRNNCQFQQANAYHQQALQLARQVADTLEMVQALNELGTDNRREGKLEQAANYHLQAYILSQTQSQTECQSMQKCRVKALNGLGNIYLTMGELQLADSTLRLALAGERALGSQLGQAINLSNLGNILEQQGQIDSAWFYYQESLRQNQECGSVLGEALCHNHFGRLFELQHQPDRALQEYETARQMMEGLNDDWHRLDMVLSIAHIYIVKGETARAAQLLEECLQSARQMGSLEHRIAAHKLFYELYQHTGNARLALDNYVEANELEDSLKGASQLMQIQNARVGYHRQLLADQQLKADAHLAQVRHERNITHIMLGGVLLLSLIGLGVLWYVLHTRTAKQRLLRKVSMAREQFFTNVTHEFRTPLTVILGLGHQLEEASATDVDSVHSAAKMIVRQGDALLRLINQLLDVSRVRSAVGEPKWQRGNVVAFVEMALEGYQNYAASKYIELSFSHSLTSIEMDFAPDYVQKIVQNLVGNAIKFTPSYGKVNVTLEPTSTGRVKLQVFDTGKGIPQEDLPHLFEAFYRVEPQGSEVGSGIGLSLVKLMVEAMHGTVSVESIVGQGSTFTVMLPKRQPGALSLMVSDEHEEQNRQNVAIKLNGREEQIAPADDGGGDVAPRILIVEDNQDIAHYIGLNLPHCQPLYARSGQEALQLAQATVPDLVITDVMMPGEMGGLQLCRCIRESDLLSHVPIIIVTAKTTEDDRLRGIEAGADAYIAKPFKQEELLLRVNKLLERQRKLRQKFMELHLDEQERGQGLSAFDRQFMNKLIDSLYALMAQGSVDVESLASRMAMSRSQLNRRVLAITGLNTSSYMMRVRLAYAKRLLKADVLMPVGDVALKCGFDDVAYFSRVFKQAFDLTPSQYRRQN